MFPRGSFLPLFPDELGQLMDQRVAEAQLAQCVLKWALNKVRSVPCDGVHPLRCCAGVQSWAQNLERFRS